MKNDLLRLAIERSCDTFEPAGDTFNLAGLSLNLMKLANLKGIIDGELCRVIITGRDDVEPMPGGCHFRMLTPKP